MFFKKKKKKNMFSFLCSHSQCSALCQEYSPHPAHSPPAFIWPHPSHPLGLNCKCHSLQDAFLDVLSLGCSSSSTSHKHPLISSVITHVTLYCSCLVICLSPPLICKFHQDRHIIATTVYIRVHHSARHAVSAR